MPEPKVTLQTIADRVGVSRMTVSNAFAHPERLSGDLRRRILATAEDVGYAGPDPLARGLRRGRADAVGVVLTETLPYAFDDPYAVGFLSGFAAVAEQHGVGLLLVPAPPGRDARRALARAAVDACCCYSLADDHPAADVATRRGLPTVFVDNPRRDDRPFVGIDNHAAACEAVTYLVELGHRDIALVTCRVVDDDHEGWSGPDRLARQTYTHLTGQRVAGARTAMEAAGLDPDHAAVYEATPNSREAGRRAGMAVLTRRPRPTAVFCFSDQQALGVMAAAEALGLRVPEDVSVIGFDDSPSASPAGLSTVAQPSREKGAAAAAVLLDGGTGTTRHRLLPHRLVVRTTTGPAPA